MTRDLNSEAEKIEFIDKTNDLVWNMRGIRPLEGFDPLIEGTKAMELAKELNYEPGYGKALLNKGMASFILFNDFKTAIEEINGGMEIFKKLNDKKWVANAHLTLAILYNTATQTEPALYNGLKGNDYYINSDINDPDFIMCNYILGTIYKDLKKYSEAEVYYKKGVSSVETKNTKTWSGRIYSGLSNVYTEQKKYAEAIDMGLRALEVLKGEGNTIGESRALTDIAIIYKKEGKFEEALTYLFEGLKIREESGLKQFEISSLSEISSVYQEFGETQKAIDYLLRAALVAKEIKQPGKESRLYKDISQIYKSTGNFEKALEYSELFISLTISINEAERELKIEKLQNSIIHEKEQEIERLRNVELKNAYDLITEKNKEITDSIRYAKRIQKALLASDDLLNASLGNHFVLYKPKDIVSGDFYWATSVTGSLLQVTGSEPEANNKNPITNNQALFYLAVCDSTGHGVPGAFMSLLNITFLNEAINEKGIKEPHLIFNHVRQRLIQAISQEGGKDGMDGILLCINKSNGKLTYSAANNSPILISQAQLTELSCNKMPVGKGEVDKSFDTHTIDFKPGDMLYLCTDGFADQFGGPKGKKFKYKQLEELLLEIHLLSLNEQQLILNQKFETWKGQLEQVDDICIIGIRIS